MSKQVYYANVNEDSSQEVIGEAGMTAERLMEVILEFRSDVANVYRPIAVSDGMGRVLINEQRFPR